MARAGSLAGCWIQKPLVRPVARIAVTTPGTLVTDWPLTGDRKPAPWTSWMVSGLGCGRVGVGVGVTVGASVGAAVGVPVGVGVGVGRVATSAGVGAPTV